MGAPGKHFARLNFLYDFCEVYQKYHVSLETLVANIFIGGNNYTEEFHD